MPPYSTVTTTLPIEELHLENHKFAKKNIKDRNGSTTILGEFKTPLIWINIISITLVHAVALMAFLTVPYFEHKRLVVWGFLTGWAGGFGITGGAHRLWCHCSYKAKLPLRIILIICYALAGQNRLTAWVRDHRVHHKFSETEADPHDSNRGFFFAHVGWLMMRKHPEVLKKGRVIDCSDVMADPVVAFNERYFWTMKILFCFIIPTAVPYYCFGETFYWSMMCTIGRYVCGLNFTWLVNSAAHIFGNRPYDSKIKPVENLYVSILALGEGWHNYHHTFPWDYKAAELGNYSFNATTMLIDMFAKIGWAYDLKYPSQDLIEKVARKYGDGTHIVWGTEEIPDTTHHKTS